MPAAAPIDGAVRAGDCRLSMAGWVVQPTDRLPGLPAGEGPGERRFLLMHADHGVAVLDLWSPDGLARDGDAPPVTRACLDAQIRLAAFLRRLDPRLPVRLIHLAAPELPRLAGVLARAFAGMEPLRLGDGGAWMGAVQDMLAAPATAAMVPHRPQPRAAGRPRLVIAIAIAAALGGMAALALLLAHGGFSGAAPPVPAMAGAPPLPLARPPIPPPAVLAAAAAPLPDAVAPRRPPPEPLPASDAPLTALPVAAEFMPAVLPPAPKAPRDDVPASPPPEAEAPAALDHRVVEMLVARGNAMLDRGDISAARLLFGRAAAAGSVAALTAMGRSYDPAVLAALGVRGIRPDPHQAAAWYRRAAERGTAP